MSIVRINSNEFDLGGSASFHFAELFRKVEDQLALGSRIRWRDGLPDERRPAVDDDDVVVVVVIVE